MSSPYCIEKSPDLAYRLTFLFFVLSFITVQLWPSLENINQT